MLTACRADVTQYTIWHRSHVEPALPSATPGILNFLQVDIDALASIVDDLCFAYWRVGRQAEVTAVLERLRGNIKATKWQRKVTYFQALQSHVLGDERTARNELEKLGLAVESEADVEILQLYMDLYCDDLAFSQRVAVCDQILKHTVSTGDILQYNGLKAFCYAGVGDTDHARNTLAVGIAEARRRAEKKKLSLSSRNHLAALLSFMALLTQKQATFDEAVALFDELLSETDAWTPLGRAMLQRELGECHRYAGKWPEGEVAYRAALSSQASGIACVFLAECLVRQGKDHEAVDVFDSVDVATLTPEEAMDHAFIAATIAVEMNDGDRMKSAIRLLKVAKAWAPYFEERRLALLIRLQEALASGRSLAVTSSLGKWLRQPLHMLSRYGIMQPTIFGFGININAIIDDAEKARKIGQED